jgi:UDP-N-acetylmuramoyl-tripeptide--D-alanyl-D-alanine ligase
VAALTAFVKERLRPGDVLLVKASRGMKLERLVEALR